MPVPTAFLYQPLSFALLCFAPRCFAQEEGGLHSHTDGCCSLLYRAEAAGDLVGTEAAPAGYSPALGQLMFPLKVSLPMGIPGNHTLPDCRKQITGFSPLEAGGGSTIPSPFCPNIHQSPKGGTRNLVSPQVHTCCKARLGGSGQGGFVGRRDSLACAQLAAPQGLDPLLGLHSNTKPARQKQGGADLHKGARFLLTLWNSPVPHCSISMGTVRHQWGWVTKGL